MKKIALLTAAMISVSCWAQDQIDFAIKYLPNHTYTLSQTTIVENNMKYIASEEFYEALKSKGIENPTITKETNLIKSISKTGSLKDNEFSFETELLESNNPLLTKGTKFIGKCINQKVEINSIDSNTLTSEQKSIMVKAMEAVLTQIEYPNKIMKVGESFVQTTPLNLPIGNINIEMIINSTYTLKDVNNRIALFDLDQVYTLKTEIEGYEIKVSGNGTGSINYDIDNYFFTKYYLGLELDFKMDIGIFSIELKSNSAMNQVTEVQKSNI